MQAELMAVAVALLYALSSVFLRRGLVHSTIYTSVLVSFSTVSALLWAATLFAGLHAPTLTALGAFAFAGILAPGISALLNNYNFLRLGVARSTPFIASSPLVATLAAILFLGEQVTLPVISGTLLILAGAVALAPREKSKEAVPKDLMFALFVPVLIGTATVILKFGLNQSNQPILAAAVFSTSGLLTAFLVTLATGNLRQIRHSRETRLFALAGACIALAFLLNSLALSIGTVSRIFPIMSTQPLFALLFSHLFLGEHEKVGIREIAGSLVIVAGVGLITAF